MNELTDDRLLPCPGCGRNVGAPHDDEGDGIYFVDCAHCGWRGPRAYNLTDAWNRWNRRAAASTSTEGAGVKGLVWREEANEDEVWAVVALGLGCRYETFPKASDADRIGIQVARLIPTEDGGDDLTILGYGKTLDAAKAIAQADHVSRLNPPAPKVTTDEAEERG